LCFFDILLFIHNLVVNDWFFMLILWWFYSISVGNCVIIPVLSYKNLVVFFNFKICEIFFLLSLSVLTKFVVFLPFEKKGKGGVHGFFLLDLYLHLIWGGEKFSNFCQKSLEIFLRVLFEKFTYEFTSMRRFHCFFIYFIVCGNFSVFFNGFLYTWIYL
jgi:hypothetical protein